MGTVNTPQTVGPVNWIGFWTLYKREVRRFLKVAAQTVTGPAVATLLFLIVFSVALGRGRAPVDGIPYLTFLAPGLIMMAMAQNAFANASSSLLIGKVQGSISDLLMAPLSPAELTLGLALGALTRGLLVGVVVALAMLPFVPLAIESTGLVLFYALTANLMLAFMGILGGLWAQKMDQLAVVTNFVITPLTFLSGTFYSIAELPELFRVVACLNPFFYMIDGFRYAVTGYADGSVLVGVFVLMIVDTLLAAMCLWAITTGWRLKS